MTLIFNQFQALLALAFELALNIGIARNYYLVSKL